MTQQLVVKATAGAEAPERCAQAFTVAATAAASGIAVTLWLTGEATWFAVPGRAAEFDLPHSTPLDELLTTVLESGSVIVCTQCAARRDLRAVDLVAGVIIAGAASFVAAVTADGVQALVY